MNYGEHKYGVFRSIKNVNTFVGKEYYLYLYPTFLVKVLLI